MTAISRREFMKRMTINSGAAGVLAAAALKL